ncbi:MAG: ACT domain-containing protein [Gammaproteobacteria bacterium]|nr:ACT domain-containing protein [Gammaproteobacteria bacterium]
MNNRWFMMTVVGKDQVNIVARVTQQLYEANCELGEASMLRLGGNFSIMMMVAFAGDALELEAMMSSVADDMDLRVHVDVIEGQLHAHSLPDVCVHVSGADRPGIVAQVAGALAKAGLSILDLESDVAGSEQSPIYVMQIEGCATLGIEALEKAIVDLDKNGLDVSLNPIETLIG